MLNSIYELLPNILNPPWCDVSSMDLKRKGRVHILIAQIEICKVKSRSPIQNQNRSNQNQNRSLNLGSSKYNQLTAMSLRSFLPKSSLAYEIWKESSLAYETWEESGQASSWEEEGKAEGDGWLKAVRGEVEMRKQRETDQTDGTARRGRREYVRGLSWEGIQYNLDTCLETPKGTREGDTQASALQCQWKQKKKCRRVDDIHFTC